MFRVSGVPARLADLPVLDAFGTEPASKAVMVALFFLGLAQGTCQ
jgi:hypothetical protein